MKSFNWTGKKVLVTGAGGFIGSHLTEALVQKGATVRALCRYNSRGTFGWLHDLSIDSQKNLELIQGDLRDADSVYRVVKGVDYVFHLGAIISIPYSYVSPGEVAAVNVEGTQNVLNACREFNVTRMMHTSTSEVYGTAQYVPIDEKHPLQGQSPYSASKIGADMLVKSYSDSFELPVVTVRPFNTFGPRQSARAVIPNIISQLLAKTPVKLGSLTPTRDFTFVLDTADAMIKSMEVDGVLGRTINLGTGQEIAISELADLLSEIIGQPLDMTTDANRIRPKRSEVNRLLSDNRLAKELLQWTPAHSLRQGLVETVKWFQSHMDEYERAIKNYVI